MGMFEHLLISALVMFLNYLETAEGAGVIHDLLVKLEEELLKVDPGNPTPEPTPPPTPTTTFNRYSAQPTRAPGQAPRGVRAKQSSMTDAKE